MDIQAVTPVSLESLPGYILIRKYKSDTFYNDCCQPVRLYVERHYQDRLDACDASYAKFSELKISMWKAEYFEYGLHSMKRKFSVIVVAESCQIVLTKLLAEVVAQRSAVKQGELKECI